MENIIYLNLIIERFCKFIRDGIKKMLKTFDIT